MAQTVLGVIFDVQPASAELLRSRIRDLKTRQKTRFTSGAQPYDHLRSAVPLLHFMSLTVFRDDRYDPLFVLEANFDGKPGPFWGQLEAAIGRELRDMLRCCKPPRDKSAALFEAVVQPESRAPVAPLLEARTVRPLVYHQGNRGLDRTRILNEGKLFVAVQHELNSGQYRQANAAQIHQKLRAVLLPLFPWLAAQGRPRIGAFENIADWVRLVALVVVAITALGAPWWIVGLALLPRVPNAWLGGALIVTAPLVSVACVLAGLRWLERRDPSQEGPVLDEEAMRRMARREDRISQNHMISIVLVKPGVLRAVLLRAGLKALGLFVRVKARNGYLNSMRTIHFAHWALVSNGGRLMFHSNYDGSWESYLDDFIEKAHGGLTFAWTSGVGFPPTRFMLQGGATNGRLFKAWGRHSMSESLFWFSAYREYSVNQIERQTRVANGLHKPSLTEDEAAAWAIDL